MIIAGACLSFSGGERRAWFGLADAVCFRGDSATGTPLGLDGDDRETSTDCLKEWGAKSINHFSSMAKTSRM